MKRDWLDIFFSFCFGIFILVMLWLLLSFLKLFISNVLLTVTAGTSVVVAYFAYKAYKEFIKPIKVEKELKKLDDFNLLINPYCNYIAKIDRIYSSIYADNKNGTNNRPYFMSELVDCRSNCTLLITQMIHFFDEDARPIGVISELIDVDSKIEPFRFMKYYNLCIKFGKYNGDKHASIMFHNSKVIEEWSKFKKNETDRILHGKPKSQSQPTKTI